MVTFGFSSPFLRRFWALCMCLILGAYAQAQSFYDLQTIQKIEIYFSQTNWDYQLDTAKAGNEGYILANWVKVNGVQFDSVGVKYKGNSSYKANQVKNPFHIKLDWVKGNQDYNGIEDIKLSNCYQDPTMLREVLSYRILSHYMHAPQANYAQVYINGAQIGLYTNVEDLSEIFVADHFYTVGRTFVKGNPDTPGPNSTSSLVYLGTDSASYYSYYEIKEGYWKDLLYLINVLKNNPSAIPSIVDVDRAIWMLAFNNVLVNLDSYSGAFSQNYYLAMDNDGLFNPVIWDLNMSFGGFPMTGSGQPMSLAQMQSMTPTLHSTNAQRPLIQQLLSNATYKKMYIAHMKTLTAEMFGSADYKTEIANIQAIIDTSVQADPNKFYTYTQFQQSINSNISAGTGPFGTIPGVAVLMDARVTYLNGTTEFQNAAPEILSVNPSNTAPAFGSNVTITAAVTNALTDNVWLGYRYFTPNHFTKVLMYDDGMHNDGAANDLVYGATIPVTAGMIEYYVYAQNASAGIFSPARAEHEFYTLNATVQMANAGELVINELMAMNTQTVTDPSGAYADWIELYNNTSSPINMTGLYLTDNYTIPTKWAFPTTAVIPAQGYLIIWADQDTTSTGGLHCNFKLTGSGERVMLTYANGNVLDSVSYGAQTADVSFGRFVNGTGVFQTMPPTFNAQNTQFVAIDAPQLTTFEVYPNPAQDHISIHAKDNLIQQVGLWNMVGQQVFAADGINALSQDVQLTGFTPGVYFLKVNNQNVGKIIIE